ncbi:unnamed protein product [Mytilus coruscus]|uniref:Uncharacterized protein n=1 Tax=Mytilus coruscus TaxID=42192 RepID=A0A6J8EE28_MYTCO|nr:unnamed protein product [Mytilus coruscus]
MEAHLKQPPEMNFSSDGNMTERWKKWRQTMELYLDVALSEAEKENTCKALLNVIGQEGRDIFNTFDIQEGDKGKIEPLFTHFEIYCIPRKNVTMERYKFNTRVQGKSESIDQFVRFKKHDTKLSKRKVHGLEECESNSDSDQDEFFVGSVTEKRKTEIVGDECFTTYKVQESLEKPYHIEIDKSVQPLVNAPRNIPAALRKNLKETLKDMEEKQVIRKVDEPTD